MDSIRELFAYLGFGWGRANSAANIFVLVGGICAADNGDDDDDDDGLVVMVADGLVSK